MVETCYNIIFGIFVLLIMSIFGGDALMWLLCPIPDFDCIWHGTFHTSTKI